MIREIGTRTFRDPAVCSLVYDAAASLTCYGTSDPDKQSEALDRFSYDFCENKAHPTLRDRTLATRVLTLKLKSGTTVDGLKYLALNGTFFEDGGVSCSLLPEGPVRQLNELFRIR